MIRHGAGQITREKMISNTPALLAHAMGQPSMEGREFCFYCGGSCDKSFPVSEHRAGTFTAFNLVLRPQSQFVCRGCVIATTETHVSRPRTYSWIITASEAKKFSKGDLAAFRDVCLHPPQSPFSIIAAVSGKKHLIYLAPVNLSRGIVTVQCEIERITYRPVDLARRLELATMICAASGKPALNEPPSTGLVLNLSKYYLDFDPLLAWWDVWQEPLSRLASFLVPKKEEAQNVYGSTIPADSPAAANVRCSSMAREAGGTDGPGLFG